MGFVEAFKGALHGDFADQWMDFYTVPIGISATAGLFPAMRQSINAGRGTNTKNSENIITNGSKILIPEGFALVTLENGAVTGFIAEPGGYIYSTDSVYSASFLSGGGLIESIIKNSWERFKFGGEPSDQQLLFFINLKEIPNNRFGTQSEIYWDDAYLGAQAGAIARGTYTLKITDPILFIKGFVPIKYLSQNAAVFDFADFENDAAEQLFNEVIQSLAAALSNYTNDPARERRISRIQSDSIGFAQSLSETVESSYYWRERRGLQIVTVAIQAIEYDEATRALLVDVQHADALSGQRGNSFAQQSVARGMEAAGSNPSGGGPIGIGMMGMALGATNAAAGILQQSVAPATGPMTAETQTQAAASAPAPNTSAAAEAAASPAQTTLGASLPAPATSAQVPPTQSPAPEDPYEKLTRLKGLLDTGVITQEDFDTVKAQILGL
ncbi:MAG: SPFH domain-containing protein [Coriobacteriales bacterium]|jgi:membrane protease subunit (stomatin/prohibitin family)|nr:SPFH domain-containing protein [Coriobacteriales bacterium]